MARPSPKHLLATSVVAFALAGSAAAAELPAFEVSSFPATPVQLSVIGAAGAQEQAATPTLTRDGMPASPLQLTVLAPRHGNVRASNDGTVGSAH